jgi:hypothetical protein
LEFGNKEHIKKRDSVNLLYHLEVIADYCETKGLSDEITYYIESDIKAVSSVLGLSQMEAILFACLLNQNNKSQSDRSLETLARNIKCKWIRFLNYICHIEGLEKKKLIRSMRYSVYYQLKAYYIPEAVVKSLCKNEAFKLQEFKNLSVDLFFDVLNGIFRHKYNETEIWGDPFGSEYNASAFNSLFEDLDSLIANNQHLSFIKRLNNYKLNRIDLIILFCFFDLYINNHEDVICFPSIISSVKGGCAVRILEKAMKKGEHILMKDYKLIEHQNDDECFILSDKAKTEFFKELDI